MTPSFGSDIDFVWHSLTHLKWLQLKLSECGMSVDTGIKAVSSFQSNFTPLLTWVYSKYSSSLQLLVMVSGQMCALVPSLWTCSQSMGSGEVFFFSECKTSLMHASVQINVPFTYFQFPDCQCIPYSASHAGFWASTHDNYKELLTFCLEPMDGLSQKNHQTCHSHP